MKKIFSIFLVFALGVMVLTGCSQTQTSSGDTVPTGTEVAGSVGTMMLYSTTVDGTALGLLGASSAAASGPQILTASDLEYSGGWWTCSYSSGSGVTAIAYTYKIRAYKAGGTEIITESELTTANVNKVALALTMTYGSVMTFSFGTESDPLTFDGIESGTKSIDGPISITTLDDDGSEYVISLDYGNVTLDDSGYPLSGTSSFTLSGSSFVAVKGTITYGGSTATLVYTEPTELTGTTYTIDMATGAVTVSSL